MMDYVLPVLGLALLDSINPSALVVTLYLLTQPRSAIKGSVYMAAVFGMCFSIEGLLILGFGAVLAQVGQALQHPGAYAVQATLGMVMLVYSIVAGDRKVEQQRMRLPDSQSLGAIFLLGMLINQWC